MVDMYGFAVSTRVTLELRHRTLSEGLSPDMKWPVIHVHCAPNSFAAGNLDRLVKEEVVPGTGRSGEAIGMTDA